MPPPLVSIVIDNFNYAPFLAQSIDSALTQSYSQVEVVVVDDLSTDGSREIIERYAGRIIAVFQGVNRGQGAAFNAGFAASHGDIVMFLDADDFLYHNTVERVVQEWQPGQSKTHFRLDIVDVGGRLVDVHPAREVRLDRGEVVPLLLEFGRYETVVTSGNAFSREALAGNLPMPEEAFRIAADGYLATVVPFHGPVGCIEECLGAYRVHGTNAYAAGGTSATSGQLCIRARKFLAHDDHKEAVLERKALASGFRLTGTPKLRDPNHLEWRLASLRLDPAGHPYGSDTRIRMTSLGLLASRRARLSRRRRALLALWFLMVGVLPRSAAIAAIRWKLQAAARPRAIDRNVKLVRRLLG